MPRPADGGVSPAAPDALDVLRQIGALPPEVIRPEPYVCAEHLDMEIAFESGQAGRVTWTRCAPAGCPDRSQSECWIPRNQVPSGIGYARDLVSIKGPQTLDFATTGDPWLPLASADLISIEKVSLAPGREGLLISTKVPGTNHGLLQCLLAWVGARYACLSAPELEEKVRMFTPSAAQHVEEYGLHLNADGLLIRYGVYFPGDANCCPCATIEARLLLRPTELRVFGVRLVPSENRGCAEKLQSDGGPG